MGNFKKNILLVTIDSLRADHVLKDRAHTPELDWLRERSLVYSNTFSQGPFTTFSMPSIFTSRYPSGLDYMEISNSTIGSYITNEPTISSVLQKIGYETAGFHSNPLLSNLFGFEKGFETFDSRLPFSETDVLPGRGKIFADKLFRIIRKHPYLPADMINERAVDWLDQRDSKDPFFLWIHYMDVHGPYISKDGSHYLNKYLGERLWRKATNNPEGITKSERERLRELYRSEVEYTDEQLGDLFLSLRDRNVWNDTILVVTSDHGEGLGERGWFAHPHQLYDELTHVPLYIRKPESSPKQIESVVELLDLAPTLVDQANGAAPESFSGDCLPESDNRNGLSSLAVSEAEIVPKYHGSIRTPNHRYIRNEVEGHEGLYDVRMTIDEQKDIGPECPHLRRELAGALDNHLSHPQRKIGSERDVSQADIEDLDVRERLRNLGYLN